MDKRIIVSSVLTAVVMTVGFCILSAVCSGIVIYGNPSLIGVYVEPSILGEWVDIDGSTTSFGQDGTVVMRSPPQNGVELTLNGTYRLNGHNLEITLERDWQSMPYYIDRIGNSERLVLYARDGRHVHYRR